MSPSPDDRPVCTHSAAHCSCTPRNSPSTRPKAVPCGPCWWGQPEQQTRWYGAGPPRPRNERTCLQHCRTSPAFARAELRDRPRTPVRWCGRSCPPDVKRFGRQRIRPGRFGEVKSLEGSSGADGFDSTHSGAASTSRNSSAFVPPAANQSDTSPFAAKPGNGTTFTDAATRAEFLATTRA